jgi:cytochrome c-type biogenesis protein CcmF
MAVAFVILPAGPLLAWKRGDALAVLQRLSLAGALAIAAGLLTFAMIRPREALASAVVGLGLWLVLGALEEAAGRVRLFRAPLAETARRFGGLPRGAWGMTLAHLGLGLFVMGAAFETTWRNETAAVLTIGAGTPLGTYHLQLTSVGERPGPNYDAERGVVRVTDASGRLICTATPERRTYDTGGQTTSKVALCLKGLDDLYIVLGERRTAPDGGSAWLVRGFANPWVRLIFLGPLVMAVGGALSLSDRRLRFAAGQRRRAAEMRLAPAE